MRNLFIWMFIANIVLTFASLLILPERVAIHFGPGGRADNWASSHFNALLMTTVQVILFCAIYFNRRLVLMFPRKMINLPNREYWLSPANFDRAMGKMQDLLWNIGAVMFLLLFVMGLLSLKANLSAPVRLDEAALFTALGLFTVYIICWLAAYYRAFRIPAGQKAHAIQGSEKQKGR